MKRQHLYLLLICTVNVLAGLPLRAQTGPVGFRMGFVKVKIQPQAPVKLISGKISSLTNIRKVNIRYDRDSMKVCDYNSEAAYLDHRCEDKESSVAKSIREKWAYTHKEVCEPYFEEYFNKNGEKIGITGTNYSDEKVPILLVHITMEDPHHHTQVLNTPPYIIAECMFFDESGARLAVFEVKAIGSSNGDIQERLRDCYAIAGKMLAKDLAKRIKDLD